MMGLLLLLGSDVAFLPLRDPIPQEHVCQKQEDEQMQNQHNHHYYPITKKNRGCLGLQGGDSNMLVTSQSAST